MNVLSIIEEYENNHDEMPSILLSGSDERAKELMVKRWIDMIHQINSPHIVVDMTKMCYLGNILAKSGVVVGASIPGSNAFTMFGGDQISCEDRLRVRMANSGWSEEKKDKAIAYIKLLQHIHRMQYGEPGDINLELISMYSAPKVVEYKIQQLVNVGIIDYDEQFNILGRYSELSGCAPDLENLLISHSSMSGITMDNKIELSNMINDKVLYVHVGKVKDVNSRKSILELITGMITDYVHKMLMTTGKEVKPYITVYSAGNSSDSVIAEFFEDIQEISQILFISNNAFAIENYSNISQCFPVRLYSRHDTMEACENVEKCFGSIYVRKKTYATARDMHYKSRGLLDRIMGTDVVLTETTSDQTAEAKYRKEDVAAMPAGYCIVSYAGRNFMSYI